MTLMSFFGCTFIAFGPAFSMVVLTVAPDAQQVIVLITSAFFWLLSLLVSGMWWRIFNLTILANYISFSLISSVVFQEVFRYVLWLVLKKAEDGLLTMTDTYTPLKKLRFHYVLIIQALAISYILATGISNEYCISVVLISSSMSGLGFGLMSGLFAMVNILADITGPGSLGLYGDSYNFLVISAFLTNCVILLHTFWGIVFFDAMDGKKWNNAIVVWACHMLFSGLTLLNKNQIYWPSMTIGYVLLVFMGLWSFFVVGGTFENVKRALE